MSQPALRPGELVVRNLDDHFNFDGNIERQRAHADRRARVFSDGLAEDGHEQVRRPVDHGRVIGETVDGVCRTMPNSFNRSSTDLAAKADDAMKAVRNTRIPRGFISHS